MNDEEFATLVSRENRARELGFKRNAYTCEWCLAEGKSLNNSTYLDWPVFSVDGKPLCDRHSKAVLIVTG